MIEQEFFEVMNDKRDKVMGHLMSVYEKIGPMLCKLEGIILKTSSGKSESMTFFYNDCETKIFKAIIE